MTVLPIRLLEGSVRSHPYIPQGRPGTRQGLGGGLHLWDHQSYKGVGLYRPWAWGRGQMPSAAQESDLDRAQAALQPPAWAALLGSE